MPKQTRVQSGYQPNRTVVVAGAPVAGGTPAPTMVVVHQNPPITHAHNLHVSGGGVHKPPHRHHVSHTRTIVNHGHHHGAPMLTQFQQAAPMPLPPTAPAPQAPLQLAPAHGTVTHTTRFAPKKH